MKALKCLLVLMSVIMLPGLVSAEIQKAKYSVELKDAAGDVSSNNKSPGKDVVNVILNTDGKNLNITAVLAKDAKFYLDGHQAGKVIDVILDTDNKGSTGGKPFSYKDPGFEYLIELSACIEYGDSGKACTGSLSGSKATNFFSTYALKEYTEGSSTKRISDPFNWKSRGKDIQGNKIEVSIPYSAMKLKPGQTIRVAVKEGDDFNMPKKGYLPEVLLTIK